jgi:hypothetical protein
MAECLARCGRQTPIGSLWCDSCREERVTIRAAATAAARIRAATAAAVALARRPTTVPCQRCERVEVPATWVVERHQEQVRAAVQARLQAQGVSARDAYPRSQALTAPAAPGYRPICDACAREDREDLRRQLEPVEVSCCYRGCDGPCVEGQR